MAFTRPIVHPAARRRPPVTRASVSLLLGMRPWAARWGPTFVVVGLLVFLVWGTAQRSVAADRTRRAEVEVRESLLYRRLSNQDAILESQRRVYIQRIRKLEAQLRERDREISALRTRVIESTPVPTVLPLAWR